MQNTEGLRRLPKLLLVIVLALSGLFAFSAAPANAAALSTVSWSTSKGAISDTSVRYTWLATTATTGTIATITATVPTGTTVTGLSVGDYQGIGAGTVAGSGTTVTYTVTSPVSVPSGTQIVLGIDGFTNTSTVGSYTSNVTTNTAGPSVIDGPTATSNSVVLATPNDAVSVDVARSLAFTNSVPAMNFTLNPNAVGSMDETAATNLGVSTNAASGYTLSAQATSLTGNGQTISGVTANPSTGVAAGSFTGGTWGFTVAAPTNGGTAVTRAGALATNQYVGYPATAAAIATQTGPTTGDTVPLTVRVKITNLTPAATYASTVTYTVAPSY